MDMTNGAEPYGSANEELRPDDYRAFLEAKIAVAPAAGLPCELDEIPTHLTDGRPMKDHVRHIVRWAVEGGRRALFESFGLHKTMQQLLIGSIITGKTSEPGLIVLPLNVRREFIRDAELLGIPVAFAQSDAEIGDAFDRSFLRDVNPLILTNYESVREGKITVGRFGWASLDEADVLRSYGSKTFQEFLPLFADVPYRHVATATPAPNRYKEMIHYAGFLGIMDTGQALTRFFQRNPQKANDLTLYPHKVEEFWTWVNSWAVCIQRPSDLGFSDEGYEQPPIEVRWHCVQTDIADAGEDSNGQGRLLRDAALGVVEASREKRRTLDVRMEKAAEIVAAAPGDHFIVWHDLEDERKKLEELIPASESVFGSQKLDVREDIVSRFADGELPIIGAKPIMLGGGVNLQRHCHRAIFAGVGHKFRDFIQAIHRIQRFGQEHQVEIDIIHAETETEVVRDLQAKWARDEEFRATMSDIIRTYGLNHAIAAENMRRSIGCERRVVTGEGWSLAHNDCVDEAARLEEGSVDLIVTSIPFSNHFEYTPSYNDFGHTDDNAHFFAQMDYLTPQLYRALAPGRLACIHVKDRILFGSVTGEGVPTVSPFHAETLFHFMQHGFQFMGMITVVTDVVRENNQTYRLSYSEMLKDGTKMGAGSPEYVLLMRKPQTDRTRGYADVPVTKAAEDYSLAKWQIDAHAFWRSSGERPLTVPELWEVEDRFSGMAVGKIVKRFREETRDLIHSHRAHVGIGETIEARAQNDERGHLPRTFMAIAPGSHHPDVWDDIVRMRTLNADQVRKGAEKHVCLARGSRVLTRERGYVAIEEVLVGEHALTHMGRWRPVEIVACTGVRRVITVCAQGVPGLTVTPNHNLWTRKSAWARERDGAERVTPGWSEAAGTLGAYINLKLPPVEDEGRCADDLTWWIVGRWLADGHFGARGDIHISCGQHEVEALKTKLGDRWGTSRNTGTAVQVRIRARGTALRDILGRCGIGAAGKHLPPEAFSLDQRRAGELLEGYLSGDGHFRLDRNRWMASSISRDLLLGMAMLAQRVHGTIASVYSGRGPRSSEIEGRPVQCRQDWIMSFDMPVSSARKQPFILDDGAWKKVRSLEESGDAETWCLRVAEDASFTAEGCIVKNCPLQFDIVDRLIERYSNKGDLVFDPFCGLGTVPMRAVLQDRRGAGSELNPDYFAHSVSYLREVEDQQAVPTLFDLLDMESDGEPTEQAA